MLVAVSPEVRDELVELGVAPYDKFVVIRLGIPLEERLGDATGRLPTTGACTGFRGTRSSSAGWGA